MQQTTSATPLDAVLVAQRGEVTDVWLRRDIARDLIDGQEVWTADEVCGTLQGAVTAAEVAEDFDVLWDVLERAAMTGHEREVDTVTRERENRALAEQADAQSWYTAVMTDTLLESEE